MLTLRRIKHKNLFRYCSVKPGLEPIEYRLKNIDEQLTTLVTLNKSLVKSEQLRKQSSEENLYAIYGCISGWIISLMCIFGYLKYDEIKSDIKRWRLKSLQE